MEQSFREGPVQTYDAKGKLVAIAGIPPADYRVFHELELIHQEEINDLKATFQAQHTEWLARTAQSESDAYWEGVRMGATRMAAFLGLAIFISKVAKHASTINQDDIHAS